MSGPIGLLWGEARAADFARYWIAAAVAADDGVGFALEVESDDASPAGLGGECLFSQAFITVRAAAGMPVGRARRSAVVLFMAGPR